MKAGPGLWLLFGGVCLFAHAALKAGPRLAVINGKVVTVFPDGTISEDPNDRPAK
jgi:hypothetical protein